MKYRCSKLNHALLMQSQLIVSNILLKFHFVSRRENCHRCINDGKNKHADSFFRHTKKECN